MLEILIAGLILTAGIAATMYLFRLGYGYLEKARQSNVMSSKLLQAAGLLKTLDLDSQKGAVGMGDGLELKWQARLLMSSKTTSGGSESALQSLHELRLYSVDLTVQYQGLTRDYRLNVFRYRPLLSPAQIMPR